MAPWVMADVLIVMLTLGLLIGARLGVCKCVATLTMLSLFRASVRWFQYVPA
jgi:hypothetical protein